MTTFQKRLQELMYDKRLSAAELAERTGISASTISRYINGISEPNMEKMTKLSKALGATESYLSGNQQGEIPTLRDYIAQYGQVAVDALDLYLALDDTDAAEIRGEMRGLLKAEKYKK